MVQKKLALLYVYYVTIPIFGTSCGLKKYKLFIRIYEFFNYEFSTLLPFENASYSNTVRSSSVHTETFRSFSFLVFDLTDFGF
jgi:hypothetical protein